MAVPIRVTDDTLTCPDCEADFKNKAGLGAHRSRKHGIRLDGTIVEGEVIRVTFHLATDLDVKMPRQKVREILVEYPIDVLDTVVG